MIVPDSSVWISYFHAAETEPVRKLRLLEDTREILVPDLVLLEVLQGARSDKIAAQLENELRQFEVVPVLDEKIAVQAARNYRTLRALSVTIRGTPDLIIATYCIEHDYAVLHRDRDYGHFERHLGLAIAE